MTAATMQCPSLSIANTGCSSSEPLFASFSSGGLQEFSISMPVGSMSFDWSDFPVVYQYNEDMPAPPASSSATPAMHYSTTPLTSRVGCSPMAVPPTLPWEVNDDDATSFSVSSDEETVLSCPSEEESLKRSSSGKSLKFSDVLEIRSHAVVLGDHPCSKGLALELSWEPTEVEVVNFEVFESNRQFQRRHMSQLRLTYWERKRLLEKSTGLSEQELIMQEQRAWREDCFPSHRGSESLVNTDKAPTCPVKSCSLEVSATEPAYILKKFPSTQALSALTA